MKASNIQLADASRSEALTRLDQLEILIDELIKVSPQEERIRLCMRAAGLPYIQDPIERMNVVLEELNNVRTKIARKGGNHDQSL